MFGVKNHVNNLQYSQRFYYSNYEFYNDYDKPNQYTNDITKVFYSFRRKTCPVITKYSNQFIPTSDNRNLRTSTDSMSENLTMQDFLNAYIRTFQINNYSDFPDNAQEENKNTFRINYFPSDNYLRTMNGPNPKKKKWAKDNNSLEIIDTLLQIQKQTSTQILEMSAKEMISNQDIDYYKNLLAFSDLAFLQIYSDLRNKDDENKGVNNFILFRILVQEILSSVIDGDTSCHQILYVPNIQNLTFFMNPALCIVKNFIVKEQSYSKSESSAADTFNRQIPKIVFINLDGVQSPVNFQMLRSSPSSSLLYITIYKDLEAHNECHDEVQIFHSKLLCELISQCNKKPSKDPDQRQKIRPTLAPKVLAFPLNSLYVQSKLRQKSKQFQNEVPNLSGSSSEINFLFEACIYQQLRLFNPNIIFVSYNGNLRIEQAIFNQIIRNLTVLCDHKVILFPNLSNWFCKKDQCCESTLGYFGSKQQSSEQMTQSHTEGYTIKTSYKIQSSETDLLAVAKFLEDYICFDINSINANQFFNNLSMFNKIVSGSYSLQQKREAKPHEKFQMGKKYQYLQSLSKLQQFSYLRKYSGKNTNAKALGRLLYMQREGLIQKNKQQAEFYQKFLDTAISNISNKIHSLPLKIKYAYEKLKLHYEKIGKDLLNSFTQKKKSITFQSIITQKIKRYYAFNKKNGKQAQLKNVKWFNFYMQNEMNQKQQIFLDNFSQVIIDPGCSVIFILNFLSHECKFFLLYGYPEADKNQVKMTKLKQQSIKNNKIYLQYSTMFNKKNNLLYLYWPYQWDPIEQATCLLLQLKYQPKLVNRFQVISFQVQSKAKLNQSSVICLSHASQPTITQPRHGSTMWAKNNYQLYIFGGYFDSQMDFDIQSAGVSIVKINQNNEFTIQDVPKSILSCILRPKANYIVEQIDQSNVRIKGGYGRQFTNFYNIYSYIQYIFNIQTYKLTAQKTQRHINTLQAPIRSIKIGKYQTVRFDENEPKYLTTSESNVKHRFILQGGDSNKLVSFINDQYITHTHKSNDRSYCLFELNRSVSNIYTQSHCCPELYVRRKNDNNLLRIQIIAEVFNQNTEFSIKDFVMPNQDSLLSVCIDKNGQNMYALAESPVYTNQAFMIYRGAIAEDIQKILETKQIKLKKYYKFNDHFKNLNSKTVHWINDKLLICGGEPNEFGFRQDYILQEIRGVVRAKLIKISHHSQSQILYMKYCYIISDPNAQFLAYAYAIDTNDDDQWMLKIQKITLKSEKRQLFVSNLTTCTVINNQVCQIRPDFQCPVFVSIQKYRMFVMDTFHYQVKQLFKKVETLAEIEPSFVSDHQVLNNQVKRLVQTSEEDLKQNLQKLFQVFGQYGNRIEKNKFKYSEYPELQKMVSNILAKVLTIRIQSICLKFLESPQSKQLYRFYLQDKRRPLAKYIGIGQLGSSSLIFFRLKFSKKVAMPLKNLEQKDNILYGCNLTKNQMNRIIFSDERAIKGMIKQDTEPFNLEDIQPFQPGVDQYEINCQHFGSIQIMASEMV